MPKQDFNPTHYLAITSTLSLHIELVSENGIYFVYVAFYDELNGVFDKVTKSIVRTNRYGHSYFIKSHQRYYLSDFIKKTPF